MPLTLYARPDWNVIADATLSWVVGGEDSDYPVINAKTLESDTVAKASATTATLRATLGGPVRLYGVAAINTNWPGLNPLLTNGGAMSAQSVVGGTVVEPEDDLCVNCWWDLENVSDALATSNVWNIAVAGTPTNVAIGHLALLTEFGWLRLDWNIELAEVVPNIEKRTGVGKRKQYRIPVRVREFTGTALKSEDRDELLSLRRAAQSTILPWILIPEAEDPDVLLVQFADTRQSTRQIYYRGAFHTNAVVGKMNMEIKAEEVNAGYSLV